MSRFESPKDSGPDEARRQISIYGSELAAMAAAAVSQYANVDPPAAVICERSTTEAESLAEHLDPRLPVRIVEDGSAIAVLPLDALRTLIRGIAPDCEPFLDDPGFTGPGRMPVLAVCKRGTLMGGVEYESPG